MKLKSIRNRIRDKLLYSIPLTRSDIIDSDVLPIDDAIGNIRSCAIIGKGKSIIHQNPISEIEKCDFKIILNRVEVESLEPFIGLNIDAQIAQPPYPICVLPKKLLKRYNTKYLLSNRHRSSDEFAKFYSFYRNRDSIVCYLPDDNNMKYYFNKNNFPHATVCGTLLKVLYNIDSLEKIVFAGVDFFRYTYSNKATLSNETICPPYNNLNIKRKGDPLLKFIEQTLPARDSIFPLNFYFPKILKSEVPFSEINQIKYY